MTEPIAPKRKTKKTLFALGLGGVAGGLGAAAFMTLTDGGSVGTLGPSREIAGLVSVVYIVTAVAILAGVFAPKAGATYLNVEDAEELREQRVMLGLSGMGMAALGAGLLVLALAAPVGPVAAGTALIVFLAAVAIAIWTSLASRKRQDELMRAVANDTGSVSFYLLFFIGGGWALADHLGYAAGPSALDWLTMFYGFGLLGAFIVIGKRGLMEMR